MDKTARSRIGFVSSGSSSSGHYDSFRAFIPEDIEVDFEGLEPHGDSLYELGRKKEIIIARINDLATTPHLQIPSPLP